VHRTCLDASEVYQRRQEALAQEQECIVDSARPRPHQCTALGRYDNSVSEKGVAGIDAHVIFTRDEVSCLSISRMLAGPLGATVCAGRVALAVARMQMTFPIATALSFPTPHHTTPHHIPHTCLIVNCALQTAIAMKRSHHLASPDGASGGMLVIARGGFDAPQPQVCSHRIAAFFGLKLT
jgi:hypothetical protein